MSYADEGFRAFLQSVRTDAEQAGVSRATFDAAIAGLEPGYKLPDLILPGKPKVDNQGQAEFTKTAADYMSKPYMEKLANQGRAFFKQHEAALKRIEKATGVDPYILVAIWGRETAYGSYKLPHDAIRVLATLAYKGRRSDMFRQEFIAALKMLEVGVPRSDMKSSWAGAVGLTQFMPTEYFKHAADGDGDGKADIWRSIPDALASAARQLQGKGWVRGESWGYEVIAGPKTNCSLEGPPDARPISEWVKLGYAPAKKKAFSDAELSQVAYLMMPAGAYGPAFLAPENFKVIRLYNTSDLYALFVGHLADRIRGGGDFASDWKAFEQPKTRTVHDLQERLKGLGYPMDKIDGKIGSNTRKQIGLYQKANGLKVDCWPSDAVLAHANTEAGR
ncbi:MAG: lytic murein transglycosylase [Hyphomicrobium sp.]|nr:lytic murein transglycosylase [Hyphomicrobium sp.]